MTDLLDALAIRRRTARLAAGAAIWVYFGAAMVGIAAVQALVERQLKIGITGTVLIVATVWAGWTYWHSVLFGRHRLHHLAYRPHPYRAAFFVDLVPGLSISFSQMMRPALNGDNLSHARLFPALPHNAIGWVSVVAGWALLAGATALFVSAWWTLGAGRVGFAPEYIHPERFSPLRRGPYGRVRHPLFWSGIAISVAQPLISLSAAGLAVSAINFSYGLIYNRLEDRRLERVFGARYATYARKVPHIIPRWAPEG